MSKGLRVDEICQSKTQPVGSDMTSWSRPLTASAPIASRSAHTQDDQAETFLLKLIRGAGLTGLAGIRPRRGRVIRPLLDTTRHDLRTYLSVLGEQWIEDESNEDLANPRNRIRHRVLPELDCAVGGSTRPAIARTAGLAR
jgi:tRNA(Ile)-lysidine synthase